MKKTIKIVDAWVITGRGMIVEAENLNEGLPQGSLLFSKNNSYEWEVESRIIEVISADDIHRFPNETESPMTRNFKSDSDMEVAKSKIIFKSARRIFQYLIKPINHEEKPLIGETLIIKEI